MTPRYVTPPEQLERALRDLLTGWQEVVFSEPAATDAYRALTQKVNLDVAAALKNGATPYEVIVLVVAPEFAAADEATVSAIAWPDDPEDAATVQRALQTGTEYLRARGGESRASAPVHVEIGSTPGDVPQTPPEYREAARAALELLLSGWEAAVTKADVSDRYRRVVAETVQRVREAAEYNTTPHNLVSTLLAVAFLLPDEPEPASITTADLEALGATLHWGDDAERLYPSVFDAEDAE